MTQQGTDSNINEPNQNTASTEATSIDTGISNSDVPQSARKPRRKKKNITVRVIQEKTNQPKIANWIAGIAAVISLAVGIVTLYLFSETKKANITTRDALKHQIHIDSLDSVANVKKDTIDSVVRVKENFRADSALKLQESSVKAQIKVLQETQREFELQNKPFVQMIDMGLDNIKSGERPIIKFNFKVYGKQPVKLQDNKSQIYYWYDTNPPKFTEKYETDVISAYLGEGALYKMQKTPKIYLNKTDSIGIKNGVSYFYINGYLRYKNTVTNSENYYHYRYKFGYSAAQFDATGLIDTTVEVKPKKAK